MGDLNQDFLHGAAGRIEIDDVMARPNHRGVVLNEGAVFQEGKGVYPRVAGDIALFDLFTSHFYSNIQVLVTSLRKIVADRMGECGRPCFLRAIQTRAVPVTKRE